MAKRKKKQKTQLQKDVEKQLKRLRSTVRRYEKKGFDVNFQIPTQKRYTKKYLERLTEINYIQILNNSYKVNAETGQIKSGWHIRFEPKEEQKKYVSYTQKDYNETDYAQTVIANFRSYLSYFPNQIYSELIKFLENAISQHDEAQIAENLLIYNDKKLEDYLRNYDSLQGIEHYESDFIQDLSKAFNQSDDFLERMEEIYDTNQ